MPSILFIGDPHFQTGNIPDVCLFIEKIEALANARKPDLICIGGDLLHTHERIHTTPLNKAYEFVEKMRNIALTYVLVGNHDAINNQIFLTSNHWMNAMKEWEQVVIVDTVKHKMLDGIHLVFCPYVPNGRFAEALATNKKDWMRADCIFAHQEFFGCKIGGLISSEGDKWPENFPCVVSGHIHTKHSPQKNIYYPGTPIQHSFGESGENIVAELVWETGNDNGRKQKTSREYHLIEHNLKLPQKKIIYSDVGDVDDIKLPKKSQDHLKLTLSGSYEEFKAFKKTKKYQEFIKSGLKIIFKTSKIERKNDKNSRPNVVGTETDFSKILQTLISKEKNNYLTKFHDLIINEKHFADVNKDQENELQSDGE